MTDILLEDERRLLLTVARESVTAKTTGRGVRNVPADTLTRDGGAFVTLRISSTLRGCIGQVEPRGSLVETVHHVAAAAAADDPRFPPVSPDELQEIIIEISVLGPLEPCPGPHVIEVGRHGLVVEEGPRRGLLLPQVAVEWGWDPHTFVSNTCVKAGLRPDAWKRQARLFTFEAEVFSEVVEELPGSADP